LHIEFRKRFEDVCAGKIQIPDMTIMKDVIYAKSKSNFEEKTISRIQDFTLDDEFFKYCCLPELVQYVENFTGPNIMAMHTMVKLSFDIKIQLSILSFLGD
jgi:phytanoyl-CoA hydroxylase